MTILCEPDDRLAAALVSTLEGTVRTVSTLPDVAMTMTADPEEKLVVIGTEVPLDQVVSFSTQVRAERPDVAVILLRATPDAAALAAAARAGILEVVPAGDNARLLHAAERALLTGPPELVELAVTAGAGTRENMTADDRQRFLDTPGPVPADHQRRPIEPVGTAPGTRPNGQILTVFSAKGGTGKTTLATNIAVALAAGETRRVCLVDMDLAFGDVAISLRLTPTRTLIDAAGASAGIAGERLDTVVTTFRPGLDCVLAPVGPGDAEKVSAELVRALLASLAERYDWVVIDTPSYFSEHVLEALDASHHQVLVTTPEIPALKNLRLTLDMLDLLGYSRDIRSIVLNRSDSRGGLSLADVESAMNSPITVHVPASRDVPASINRGRPLTASHPQHPVSKAIQGFAESTLTSKPGTPAASRRFGRRGPKLRTRSA